MTTTKNIGDYGETLAVEFLKKKKYKILGRNIRTKFGEVDILAEHDKKIIVCEVKARSGSGQFGRPEEAVDYFKQQKLIKMAKWLSMDRQYANRVFQIDIVAIAFGNPPKIEHLENVILDC